MRTQRSDMRFLPANDPTRKKSPVTVTRPSYITFDMYGTLTAFGMSALTKKLLADDIPEENMESFLDTFEMYRIDEVMGDWRPYDVVIDSAFRRACAKTGAPYRESDSKEIFAAIPTWGPHPDVPEGLRRLASKYRLVILSNAAESQVYSNAEKLGAPFHAVLSAEAAKAYKPRVQAFEYMFEQLGCDPEDVMHVSSSPRYDLQPATDLGVKNTVYVNRGYEPTNPYYHRYETTTIGGVADILGL